MTPLGQTTELARGSNTVNLDEGPLPKLITGIVIVGVLYFAAKSLMRSSLRGVVAELEPLSIAKHIKKRRAR